jgi:tyrosyl-tRNA synthetase
MDSMPCTGIPAADIGGGINIIALLEKCALIQTRSEGRRLIEQGGLKLNESKVSSYDQSIQAADFKDGYIMLQKGKKIFHRVKIL